MGWIEVVSLVLNAVLGGTVIVTFTTLKSVKAKAAADAKSSELENVNAAIKIWREMAEEMASDRANLISHVEGLSVEVRRLKNATNKVVKLLDKITPENMEETIDIIKQEIDEEYTSVSNNLNHIAHGVQGSPPNIRSPNKH